MAVAKKKQPKKQTGKAPERKRGAKKGSKRPWATKKASTTTEPTPLEERFVEEYLKSGIAIRAFKASGFKYPNDQAAAVYASQLIRKPNVARLIAEGRAKMREGMALDREEIIQGLRTQAQYYGADDASHTARVSALTSLGKIEGCLTNKIDLRVKGKIQVEVTHKYIGEVMAGIPPELQLALLQALKKRKEVQLLNGSQPDNKGGGNGALQIGFKELTAPVGEKE